MPRQKEPIPSIDQPGDRLARIETGDLDDAALKKQLKLVDKAVESVCETCWTPEWRKQSGRLTRRIGKRQTTALQKSMATGIPLTAQLHGQLLLESTRAEMSARFIKGNSVQFFLSCQGMEKIVRQFGEAMKYMPPGSRQSDVAWHRYSRIWSKMLPRFWYLFVLYLTWRRSEIGTEALRELDELLAKHRILNILDEYKSGMANCFIRENGEDLFRGDFGQPFFNRYYIDIDIYNNETLLAYLQRRWGGRENDFAFILAGLDLANDSLLTVHLRDEIPCKSLYVVPPVHQDYDWWSRVTGAEGPTVNAWARLHIREQEVREMFESRRGIENRVARLFESGRITEVAREEPVEQSKASARQDPLRGMPLDQLVAAVQERLAEDMVIAQSQSGGRKASLSQSIEAIEKYMMICQRPIRNSLRNFLGEINRLPEAERSFGGLEENKQFTSRLQRLLTTVGERLCCPKCGRPGSIRCRRGTSPNGGFEFLHSDEGTKTTHGGWSRLPKLELAS